VPPGALKIAACSPDVERELRRFGIERPVDLAHGGERRRSSRDGQLRPQQQRVTAVHSLDVRHAIEPQQIRRGKRVSYASEAVSGGIEDRRARRCPGQGTERCRA
jgi:hypothetical protein